MIALDLLYDALTVFPEGVAGGEVTAVPDVATSMTPNADASVWTVTLGNRTFSDGTPINASDVQATYDRLAKKGSASLAGVRLEIINGYADVAAGTAATMSGITVTDDHTLQISLREPYQQLPELLASPLYGIVPKAAADRGGDAFADPVGSGPYAFADHDDTQTRLERAPGGPGSDVGPDDVELVTFPTWDAAYAAFGEGQVDWSLVPAASLEDATNTYGSDNFSFFGSELWFGFNLNDPTYGDPRFRQAIVQAVDSDRVVSDALPGRFPLRAIVPQGVPGFNPDACKDLCGFDQAAARSLLAQAFPPGTTVPPVVLDGYDDPVQRAMLNSVKTQLADVGIMADVRIRPFDEYRTFATSGQQAVFSFGWVGVAPTQDVYLSSLFWSGSPDNVTGFRSPDVDALIRQARSSPDEAQRESIYQQMERQILSQSAILPIAQLRTNQVVADRVHGWASRLDGTFVVSDVWVTD
jgi:oligopeptide transport system substrate-binding protein